VLLEEDSGPTSAKTNLENILHKRRISYPRDGRHIKKKVRYTTTDVYMQHL